MPEAEVVIDGSWRRRWTAAEKLRIVEETLDERTRTLSLLVGPGRGRTWSAAGARWCPLDARSCWGMAP